jgi:NAD(P)-dependent dehydrogenase (short-subunit alcohol dehydrogenase family)
LIETEKNMAFEKFDLTGKTALITGAAGLLGIEHASALLESGAEVILTDVDMDALISTKRKLAERFDISNIQILEMDVTQVENIHTVARTLHENCVRVDILVNNAAIDPKVKGGQGIVETSRLENFSIEQWNLQVAVGLTGAFLCSQVFGQAMAKDGRGGVILNISSDLSVIAPDQRLYRKSDLPQNLQPVKPITYSVIKAGLIGLTKYLSTYWAENDVRCNALSPGGVFNGQDDDFVRRLTSLIPMGRMANSDEYRATVQYLCSDASKYLNGQNIVVDGGRTVI